MSTRAVLYARVSGDDRNNSTSSLDGQLELCRDYARSHGWQIVEELAEDSRGASGAAMDLPQLNNALNYAKDGHFDVLVTREIDRLARSLAKQLVIEKEFERLGVEIEYVIGDYQNTPEGQLSKHIRAVIAEYEREKIRERMVRGRRQKVKAGYVIVHGNTLYGYKALTDDNGTKLSIDDSIAKVVRMIFEWYTMEGWGTPTIARELTRLDIPAPSVSKKTKTPRAIGGWHQSTVLRIVKNEAYAGVWRYGKRNRSGHNPIEYQIAVDVPAIVSQEVFEQAKRKRLTNSKNSKRNTKREYLLAKRCFCGECQTPMTAFTKTDRKKKLRSYSYYRCPVRYQQGTHYMKRECSTTTHFRADYWDNAVWQEIRAFLANPDKLIKGVEQYQKDQESENEPLRKRVVIIDELLEQKQEEINRLLDLYLSGEFERDMLNDHKQRLEKTIVDLGEERISLNAQMNQTLTRKQLAALRTFSEEIAEGLSEADEDFETRRRMLDYLGVRVSLALENKVQVATVVCEFDRSRWWQIEKSAVTRTSSRQPELGFLASSQLEGEGSCIPIGRHSTGYKHS